MSVPPSAAVPRRHWASVARVIVSVLRGLAPHAGHPAVAVEGLRRRVPAGGACPFEISYLGAGDPRGPRLILIHGTPGRAADWARYLIDPPPGVEVVAIDRPGFGASGPAAAVTSLEAHAAAVAALLPADGRPAILLGHSMGGPIAAWAAADHPDRVSQLILLAAALDPALESIHVLQRVVDWPVIRGLLPRPIRNSNTELLALRNELAALADRLPRIRAAVTLVHGTCDDLVPPANVEFGRQRLDQARAVRVVWVEGCNHFLPWTYPEVVRQVIAETAGAGRPVPASAAEPAPRPVIAADPQPR